MSGDKKEYDLICSLGGNCSVAHNLRYRNMRPFSLPFDWVYMENEKTIQYLIEGFADNFQNLCKRENLERLPDTKDHKLIYLDNYSGYCFPNHFSQEIETSDEYFKMSEKLKRRINRLINAIQNSKTILFILSVGFSVNKALLEKLYISLSEMFPDKTIDFNFVQFNAEEDYSSNDDTGKGVHISTHRRPYNNYDFSQTNFEWEFLDNIKWSKKFAFDKFPKKLCSFSLFSYKIKVILERKK